MPRFAAASLPATGPSARRVWHDLLAEGMSCGLHRIERLMRLQALERVHDGVACRPTWVNGRRPPSLLTCSIVALKRLHPTANGLPTLMLTSGRRRAGSMWLRSSIYSLGAWSAGR